MGDLAEALAFIKALLDSPPAQAPIAGIVAPWPSFLSLANIAGRCSNPVTVKEEVKDRALHREPPILQRTSDSRTWAVDTFILENCA